ncbi:hypothetical protein AMATHDRAFT_120795, partial [Amanita thiersii Skay4041]
RPEAGPLPQKRGEIGYIEGVHDRVDTEEREVALQLPARHPADRDSTNPPQPNNDNHSPTPQPPRAQIKSKKCILKVAGLRLTTLSICVLQFLLFSGTIAGWIISSRQLARKTAGMVTIGGPAFTVFLHVAFTLFIILQCVFIERTIYRLRAQRYAYLHPGEILPSNRLPRLPAPVIAFAPWNRPPLPTYAAALAQSGVGTGDVEDHLIAGPPPPAYGNTRGSRLLLAGFLRESLRAQRPVSEHSEVDLQGERPMTYSEIEGGLHRHEGVADGAQSEADRTRRLQETLAQLERSASRS